jgi:branched-chain amino acid transport system substrate-binding protein
MSNRNIALFIAILFLIASPFINSAKGSSTAERKEITVLHVADYTGPTSDLLAAVADGQVDYFKHVEEKGGIKGAKIKLEWFDSKYDQNIMKSSYDRFKNRIYLVSSNATPWAMIEKTISDEDKIPYVNTATGTSHLPPFSKFSFDCTTIPGNMLTAGINYFKNKRTSAGPMKVAIITVDLGYALNTVKKVPGWCKKNGIQVTHELYARGALDVTAQLTKAKANEADLLVVNALPASASVVIKDARGMGIKAPILGPEVFFIHETRDIVGPKLAEGIIRVSSSASGGVNDNSKGIELARKLFAKYRGQGKMYGGYIRGVGGAMVMEEAIRLTLEKVPADKLKPADIKYHGLDRMKNFKTGIFPPITFTTDDHRGIKVAVMETVRNGKVELIDREMKMPDLLPYFK